MKILTNEQIRKADDYTIAHEPIASIDLMERASEAFTQIFENHFSIDNTIYIYCGAGNNGGDGLAVARMLLGKGYDVQCYLMASSKYSPDNLINQNRYKAIANIHIVNTKNDLNPMPDDVLVIDALFGTGLSRPVSGMYAQVIKAINKSNATTVAIDIPSGLFSDENTPSTDIVIADLVITFQFPTLAFLLPTLSKYIKDWQVADIGLMEEYTSQCDTKYSIITKEMITSWKKNRNKNTHKGDYGKALLIAGSYGKMGATVLAARAIMRSGVGLLTVHTPSCGYTILQSIVPEAMVSIDSAEHYLSKIPDLTDYDAVAIGCGIAQKPTTVQAFEQLLHQYQRPMVIDADAINILSNHPDLIEIVPAESILTPHHREFERLVGTWTDDFHRLQLQLQMSQKHQLYILFKGLYSTITTPKGDAYFNMTGNPGMATAGSGDVLTGMIVSLLAQGYTSLQASIMGTFYHGQAGNIAADNYGMPSMIASDIIEAIPKALRY